MRVLKKVVRFVAVFLGVVLIIGGIFAASHEVHARSNGKTGILSQVFTNPEEVFHGIKTEVVKISPEIAKMFGQTQTVEVTPQKINPEEQPTPTAKPARVEPPARPAQQQPRRTAPANQSQQRQQPVSDLPSTSQPTLVEDIEIKHDNPPASEDGITITRADLQRYFPEGQVFFFSNELTRDILRQVDNVRIAHGRKPLKLNSRLVESAKAKVEDMLLYRYFDHNSPRLGSHQDLIARFMFPNPFADQDMIIASQSLLAGENLRGGPFDIAPISLPYFRDGTFMRNELEHQKRGTVQGFMNSPGHRHAMLNTGGWDRFHWHYIGVATGYIFWHDPAQENDKNYFVLDTGERYVVRMYTKHAMHFAVSTSPHYTPAEEFLRLNPDILLRVQQQGQ